MLDARSRQMAALQACMPNAGTDFTAPLLCHGCGRSGPRLTDPFPPPWRRTAQGRWGIRPGTASNAAGKSKDLRAGNLLYLCHGSR